MTALAASAVTSIAANPAPRPHGAARGAWRLDLVLAGGLALLALLIRLPHLWTIPRFTDETLEVLHSLAIVREGTRPLTNYDSYYGALYNYLVALGLALSGESPLAPRVVVLIGGALTVVATYLLGVEIGKRLPLNPGMPTSGHSRRIAPRIVGLLAAALLATNGPHVVVNSHIAWSNCLTPLLTTLAFWALLRAVPSPQPGCPPGLCAGEGRGEGAARLLLLTGLLLGLALQTHPLVVALLPGIALGILLKDWRVVRTPWPYLAAVLFLVGYANVLVYNAQQGFESLTSAQRMRTEYAQDQASASGYIPTAGSMALLLGRIVGGAVDQRESAAAYLLDPSAILVGALALSGLALLAGRREPLPALAVTGFLLILPAANPKFQTLLTSRYLMPIVPLLFACAALALIWLVMVGLWRWSISPRRALLAALLVGLFLAALPLAALDRYYARALERTDTNERILKLVSEIEAARRPDELVLVDESIGAELPDTGVTELRGLEYLLHVERVPYRTFRISTGRLQDSLNSQPSALAILNARDAQAAASRLRVESLDPRPAVESGRMFDFRLYRLSQR
jgi:4-amino-4-deoxy-L-arabinose transferase-like glycosyltransferase